MFTSMTTKHVQKVLQILDHTYPTLPMHEVHGHDAFRMLVAVILSQRARDSVTVPTAAKLFAIASTPKEFVDMPAEEIEDHIRVIGFYTAKAKAIKKLSQILIEKYDGKVPSTEAELLSLPMVGRKTANIILTTFFDTPQIAVDIHVHRITNRLGWVETRFCHPRSQVADKATWMSGIQSGEMKPDDSALAVIHTEKELTKIIPKELHSIVNRVFVAHGQTICLPRNPKCSICPVEKYCLKIGVA